MAFCIDDVVPNGRTLKDKIERMASSDAGTEPVFDAVVGMYLCVYERPAYGAKMARCRTLGPCTRTGRLAFVDFMCTRLDLSQSLLRARKVKLTPTDMFGMDAVGALGRGATSTVPRCAADLLLVQSLVFQPDSVFVNVATSGNSGDGEQARKLLTQAQTHQRFVSDHQRIKDEDVVIAAKELTMMSTLHLFNGDA
jgi:hypothetical protein